MFFAIKSKRAAGTSTCCYIIDENYDSIKHNRHADRRRNT